MSTHDSASTVKPDGTREWRNKDNELHREDGPALEYPDGSNWWYRDGRLHRDDGPAVELAHTTQWWRNGRLHREDGPAVEFPSGTKWWYLHGTLLKAEEIAELKDRPAALLREKHEQERQNKSAAEIQDQLRRRAGQQRSLRYKK